MKGRCKALFPEKGEKMSTVSILIAEARKMGVKSGNGIANIPNTKAVAEAFKMNETDVIAIKNATGELLKAYPQAAQAEAWDDQTWDQFSKLIADRLPKPAPKAEVTSLFGTNEKPAQAPQTQNQPEPKATPVASLKATVLLSARRIKASDPEAYELYGLNQRSLEQLVKDAESRFTNGFKREDVEKFVMDKMSSAAGYREARGAIHDEADDRGWTIAPRAKDGQPQTQTDYKNRVIGSADLAAILQSVQYDSLTASEAFDALGFLPGTAQKQATAQTGLFGG